MTKERNNLHRLMQKKKDGTANTVFFICASYLRLIGQKAVLLTLRHRVAIAKRPVK